MKRLIALSLIISCIAVLTSCSLTVNTPEEYLSFTDDCREVITLYSKPQRVAVLFSSFAEVWTLAGGKVDITVGESVERGFADVDAVLVDDRAGKTVNAELLLEAKPDFVICSADVSAQVEAAALVRDTGTPAACFRIESFEDYLRVLEIFCNITGDKEAFEKNGAEVASRVEKELSRIPDGETGKEVLFLRAGSSESSVKAKSSKEHFAAAMLNETGVLNIADDAPIIIDGLSMEEILLRDPDYIFISTMGESEAAKKNVEVLFEAFAWKNLTAVKNKKYVFLPKELFHYKPNARWDEAYKFLIDFIYG